MAEENKVKLHGMWITTYSKRVELALRVKGIPYEYKEEDLSNKSPLLLQYNPVYKKVPVLVHNGKPMAESYIILEYIDETWQNGPRLLPQDPYQRAQIRFWASFIQQQLFGAFYKLISSNGEEQEKAVEEVSEKMNMLERGMKELLPEGVPEVDADNFGVLDILVSATFGSYKAHEEVFGLKVLDPEKYPLMFSWVQKLNEIPLVKEVLPPHDKLVALLQFMKQKGLKPSS